MTKARKECLEEIIEFGKEGLAANGLTYTHHEAHPDFVDLWTEDNGVKRRFTRIY